jgi:hypothetical protein
MSDDEVTRRAAPKWSCCLIAILGSVAFVAVFIILNVISIGNFMRGPSEAERVASWHQQVAELKDGKTTSVRWPEPLCLETFVREQPELAAKITRVDFFEGTVADERFGYVKQFPNVEEINFDEVWEGTDSFLTRVAGMKSIETLTFYQTLVTEEGARAVASFPNLSCLRLHEYTWSDASTQQLRGHKRITKVFLENIEISKAFTEVLASLPNLQELELEEDKPISQEEFRKLRKALPKVKIERVK